MQIGIFLISLSIGLSMEASTRSSLTYEAGVVEFNYDRDPNITQAARTAANVAKYLEIMSEAPDNLDIIVFPEMTLNQMETAVEIPEPKDNVSPCDSEDFPEGNLVKQISCAAKIHGRYVVVGIVTKVECPDEDMIANNDPRQCTDRSDHMSYYNTNVVFDRNGTVISFYRKFNLYGEDVDKPLIASMVSFDTDFGVRFGHFICFDIMFRYPALELVRNESITDILYPTMWYSELPFLTAVQVQQNWAFASHVNLLAAGANNPLVGSTGTGIFAGRKGSLISVMEGTKETDLYVATVPKIGLGDNVQIIQKSIRRTRDKVAELHLNAEQLEKYNIHFLDTETSIGQTTSLNLCHNEHCCTFDYGFSRAASQSPSYSYAATVFHGSRVMDGSNYGIFVCAIIACQTNNVTTCGVRSELLTFGYHWHALEITGLFPNGNKFYSPTSLDTSIMPFLVGEFDYNEKSNGTANLEITMKSVGTIRDFYSFGIYGRDFDVDGTGGAAFFRTSYMLFIIASLIACCKDLF